MIKTFLNYPIKFLSFGCEARARGGNPKFYLVLNFKF